MKETLPENGASRSAGSFAAPLAMLGCAACLAFAAAPAAADEISDLKAEIEAQKAQSEAQKARLDALEKKLQEASEHMNMQPAMQPAPAAAATPAALETDQNGVKLDPASNPVTLYTSSTTRLRMYGILEPTISYADHQTPTGGTAFGFQVSWFSGNRLGFDIDHALDFGDSIGLPALKIISKLESEVELPTGNMDTANVFFNRDAWVGFYSPDLGKLTFGRQNTLTRDFTQNWGDAYGSAEVTLKEGGYSNVNNFKQLIFYSAGPNGTRANSAIEWKKKWDEHWVTGLAYNFGSGGNGGSGDVGSGGTLPGDVNRGTAEAASVAYNHLPAGPGRFNLNASYDRANNHDLIHQSELVGGNYVIGSVRVNGGYIHYTAQQGIGNSAGNRTDNAWTVSTSILVGKTDYALGYQDSRGTNAGYNGAGVTLNPFGNTAGVTTTGNGSKRAVFGSVMFHPDRQVDIYVAADYMKIYDGWAVHDAQGNGDVFGQGGPYRDEHELATGVRFKF
jgi:predicted porin